MREKNAVSAPHYEETGNKKKATNTSFNNSLLRLLNWGVNPKAGFVGQKQDFNF